MPKQKKTIATLVFPLDEGLVWLGLKAEGLFGGGKWNGFGGKLERNESLGECARRELKEESGLETSDITRVGILDFKFLRHSENNQEVHVFKAFCDDIPVVSDEMVNVQQFSPYHLPYDFMWSDDPHWLPFVLLYNRKVRGKFKFNANNELIDFSVKVVELLGQY